MVTVSASPRSTGGSLAPAAARAFARDGARVVIADVLTEEGQATAAEIRRAGGEALFVQTDVRQEAACRALMETAWQAYGRLDSLACCAGILRGSYVPVEEMDED